MSGKQKIGWIGLGKMGVPMSKNLVKKGYPVTVYNRTKEKTKELAAEGAKVAESPKALAADSDVILSMISDDPALEEVSIGKNGAFEGANQDELPRWRGKRASSTYELQYPGVPLLPPPGP
jgi:3-hydroxyisobutyrate dehydrogenase-like beta-hydroxyacid dehydrogenase